METTAQTMRVASSKVRLSDLLVPVLSGISSYSFIVMRVSLPPVIDQVVYYFAWFVLVISVLNIIRFVMALFDSK